MEVGGFMWSSPTRTLPHQGGGVVGLLVIPPFPLAGGDEGEGEIKSFHPHPSLSHQGRGCILWKVRK